LGIQGSEFRVVGHLVIVHCQNAHGVVAPRCLAPDALRGILGKDLVYWVWGLGFGVWGLGLRI
jgi:hypothetical protein